MRKFLLAAAFLALTPGLAQAHGYPAVGHSWAHPAYHPVVRERHQVREERRELRRERRDLQRARVARARAWHRQHDDG